MTSWKTVTLAEFVTLKRGMDLPHGRRRPGRYRVLSSGESQGTHDEGPVKGPGFVVGRATNIGRPTWSDDDYWPLNTVLYAADFKGNDPKFVYYWFLANDLSRFNSGSVQPMLNRNYIADVEVLRPPVQEQQAIAGTLGDLDAKIESNGRIARTTLDLAEALYLRGCEAGQDRLLLRDAGKWLSGGTPSTSRPDFWGGDLPWISSASLKDFFIADSERRLTPSGASAAANVVPRGTVIFVVRGMSLKSEFRTGLTQRSVAFGQDCKAILPEIPAAVLATALWASKGEILELVDEAGHGTGRLSTDLLENHAIAVPRDKSLAGSLSALIDRGAAAIEENRRLERLRDTLLPELLSGRMLVEGQVPLLASEANVGSY